MNAHDTSKLWGLAAGELDLGDARMAETHLEDCPECRDEFGTVRAIRALATHAAAIVPELEWSSVDGAVADLVERRTARSAGLGGPARYAVLPVALFAAAGIALGARGVLPAKAEAAASASQVPMMVAPPAVQPSLPSVLVAKDARKGDGERLAEGAALLAGDTLRTGRSGSALVRLPDGSRLRIVGDSQVRVVRASGDDASLSLERGRVAAQVVPAAQRLFELASGDFRVRAEGAVLSVALVRGGIEVAVASGRAHVERPNALPMLVDAGHRVVFSARSNRALPVALSADNQSDMADFTAAPGALVATAPRASMSDAPARGARPVALAPLAPPPAETTADPAADFAGFPQSLPQSPVVAAATPIPAPAPAPAASPAAAAPAPQVPGDQADDMRTALREKGETPIVPGMLLGEEQPPPRDELPQAKAAAPAPAAPPAPVADEWQPTPIAPAPQPAKAAIPAAPAIVPAAVVPAAQPAVRAADPADSGDDAEELFLLRAERALKRGGCQRFLTGLDEIAGDTPATERTERARIARAHCYQALGKAEKAKAEYQRYLRETPHGDFAAEAERQVGAAESAPRSDTRLSDQ